MKQTSVFLSTESDEKLTLDVGLVRLVDCRGVGQVALLLRTLLGQDVTLEGVLALDFASSRQLETLLGAGFGFHLRHGLGSLMVGYFFFGLNITVIRFPSNLGICSKMPTSSNFWANFSRRISPRSLNTMVRPRKNT